MQVFFSSASGFLLHDLKHFPVIHTVSKAYRLLHGNPQKLQTLSTPFPLPNLLFIASPLIKPYRSGSCTHSLLCHGTDIQGMLDLPSPAEKLAVASLTPVLFQKYNLPPHLILLIFFPNSACSDFTGFI